MVPVWVSESEFDSDAVRVDVCEAVPAGVRVSVVVVVAVPVGAGQVT